MSTYIETYLSSWPRALIRDQDLNIFFSNQPEKRYDAVKYAIRKGTLIHIKRGLYLINLPNHPGSREPFELAQSIYEPSYISLESALSYHGWIPEVVYSYTSATTRRNKVFDTQIGLYRYSHTPAEAFYSEVERIDSSKSIYLLARPWKAIADHLYVYKRDWKSIHDLSDDLRIEAESLQQSDLSSLQRVIDTYKSKFVANQLKLFLKGIS